MNKMNHITSEQDYRVAKDTYMAAREAACIAEDTICPRSEIKKNDDIKANRISIVKALDAHLCAHDASIALYYAAFKAYSDSENDAKRNFYFDAMIHALVLYANKSLEEDYRDFAVRSYLSDALEDIPDPSCKLFEDKFKKFNSALEAHFVAGKHFQTVRNDRDNLTSIFSRAYAKLKKFSFGK